MRKIKPTASTGLKNTVAARAITAWPKPRRPLRSAQPAAAAPARPSRARAPGAGTGVPKDTFSRDQGTGSPVSPNGDEKPDRFNWPQGAEFGPYPSIVNCPTRTW